MITKFIYNMIKNNSNNIIFYNLNYYYYLYFLYTKSINFF